MSTAIGFSSEIYFIEPQDILALADNQSELPTDFVPEDAITVLLGNRSTNTPDTLICGREAAQKALDTDEELVPVRFVFHSNIAELNILPLFFKVLREGFKYKSDNVYHTTLSSIRKLHIERGFRNAENAYDISKRWHISPEERVRKYTQLKESLLKNGFDDKYPISVMLCRRCGAKDCIDDGHHRIGICVENGIERIAITFRAAGTLPRCLQKPVLKIINLFPKRPD